MVDLIDMTLRDLIIRGGAYSIGGISTFILDLSVVYILTQYTAIPSPYILVIGYFIGVNVNFLIAYYWVFKGTVQTPARGYMHFLGITLLTGVFISYATLFIIKNTPLSLIGARVFVALFVGICNFLFNAFYNFKMN